MRMTNSINLVFHNLFDSYWRKILLAKNPSIRVLRMEKVFLCHYDLYNKQRKANNPFLFIISL